MKRIIGITIFTLFTLMLSARNDTSFYKHEVRVSFGESFLSALYLRQDICYVNLNISYFYRPVKWLWTGVNLVHFFGDKLYYNWRVYDENGTFKDFSKSKIKYCFVIAPEIRFSFLNKKNIILYGALSGGVGLENGYTNRRQSYPRIFPYF
jgi:hypothetical protein